MQPGTRNRRATPSPPGRVPGGLSEGELAGLLGPSGMEAGGELAGLLDPCPSEKNKASLLASPPPGNKGAGSHQGVNLNQALPRDNCEHPGEVGGERSQARGQRES